MKAAAVLWVLFVTGASVPADPARFAAAPSAVRDGDAVRISFEVTAPTDVQVAILDAAGRTVRHLAAGVLGENPPKPLLKGLSQSLLWDGKDDVGRPAKGGPFAAKVALGLRPALDRFIGAAPAALGRDGRVSDNTVRALATGPTGQLYVFHVLGELHGGEGTTVCTVFDRGGKYLRTILPYPASTPPERLRGVKRLTLAGGATVPFVYQGDVRALVPGGGNIAVHRAVATRDGRVAFVGLHEWLRVILRYGRPGIAQVILLDAEGGAAPEGILGPLISRLSTSAKPFGSFEDRISNSGASLAVSPNGGTLYATGYREGTGRHSPSRATHAVYRCRWTDKEVQTFVGHKTDSGAGKNRLNTPTSVAVDKDGNVYVADRENNRVAVFGADASYLGELAVQRPDRVEVHPKTGAVYVLGGPMINSLKKFSSWRQPQPVAEATLPCRPIRKKEADPARAAPVMALDGSADPPVLYFTPPARGQCSYTLLRVEDLGKRFSEPVDFGEVTRRGGPRAGAVIDLTIDRPRQRLYVATRRVKDYRVSAWDGRSGRRLEDVKIPRLRGGTGDVAAVGLDGNYYTVHGAAGWRRPLVARFDRELRPLPYPKPSAVTAGNAHVHHRGLTADPKGNLYVLWDKGGQSIDRGPGEQRMANNLVLYGPDGKTINRKLIDSEIRGLNSPRLDYAGNIYLAVGAHPEDRKVPDEFRGQDLGKAAHVHVNASEMNWYPLMYGCIVKFGPSGGAIRSGIGGRPFRYGMDRKTEVKGAEWIHYGASVVPSWRSGPPYDFPDTCLCEVPWFDVDGYGRSFFPDACRFRVGVLDTAGNLICTFGTYGNADAAGAQGTAGVPFCWVQAVAVSDEAVYVADRLNRRIVRARLGHRLERTCPVP